MVLGNLGLLRIGPAILLLLALAGPLWLLAWRRSAKGEAGIAAVPPQRSEDEVAYWWLAAGLLCGLGALAFASTCLQGTDFWGDDLVYHATASAKWYQQQKLSLAPHHYSGYYPMNAELFSLWFILPLGRDGMVWMAGAYWTFLFAVATFVLVRAQGQKAHVAAMCTALVLATPSVIFLARAFTACDLGAAALVMAATAMAMPSRSAAAGGDRLADATCAGLLGGLAVGAKVPMLLPALILLAVIAVLPRRTISVRQRIVAATAFATALVLTGGYWYLRNLILTGNPLFPASAAIFSGPFDAAAQRSTKLIYWLLGEGCNLKQRLALLMYFTAWPFGLFLVSAGGGLLAVPATAAPRGARRSAAAVHRRAVLACRDRPGVLPLHALLGHGQHARGRRTPKTCMRFLFIPFAFGIVLAAPLFDVKNRALRLCWALGVLAIATALGYSESLRPVLIGHYGPVTFALGAAALVSLNPVVAIWGRIRRRKTAAFGAVAAFLMAEVLLLPYHQRLTDAQDSRLSFHRQRGQSDLDGVGETAPRLDHRSRFAAILSALWASLSVSGPSRPCRRRIFPATPRAMENRARLVAVGRVQRSARSSAFVANLLKSDAEYVVVARQSSLRYPPEQWPPQYKLLRESPHARPSLRKTSSRRCSN